MISVLLGAAAMLASSPLDSTSILSKAVTPTIMRTTPSVGIKSMVMADSIVVEKAKRTLTLFLGGLPVRTYRVALGTQPVGDKIKIGDGRTPEGVYRIDFKNAQSKYHMALHISYPDASHLQRAEHLGVAPGGDIMIHGLPPRYASIGAEQAQYNWTEGCIAVTDQEIEEIYRAVPPGSPIQIKP
jgi:murein L,D-transpeptidase YafK